MGLADFRLTVLQKDSTGGKKDSTGGKDDALYWDAAIRIAEVKISTVTDLVEVAERRCARRHAKIYSLSIVGHGNSEHFNVGDQQINTVTIFKHIASWTRLEKCLTKDCDIDIICCRSGRDKTLLMLLSAFLGGRSVTAPIWDQGPGYGFTHGDDVECVVTKCTYSTGWVNWDDGRGGRATDADVKRQRNAFHGR